MVRKTKEETEKTRLSLLDAALRVFCDKGYVRSTLKDIAQEANVTRGAIYWHFKDKVALFEALSDHIDDCSGDHKDTLIENSFKSLEDMGEKIMAWLNLLETDDKFRSFYEFVNFKIEYHAELDPVLDKQREFKRQILQRFIKDFAQFQERNLVRKDIHPKQAALRTMFFFNGLVDLWLWDHSLFSIHQDVPPMVEQFLDSLRQP